ncbi:MAG: hypothetical protein OK449_10590 [Thaumarchaeota archaeon]|nr:hypothetical protein [Nitrososphaerota archaeon]
MRLVQLKEADGTRNVGTAQPDEEKLRSFRVDITLVFVGLFLALGVQNIIQFVETDSPHISPYFYLAVGVGSLLMLLVFLNLAARIAGIEIPERG